MIAAVLCVGCGDSYEPPPAISSNGFDERGMRFIESVGSPETITQIQNDRLLVDRVNFSTSPIEIRGGYAIGTRTGSVVVFGKNDSMRFSLSLQSREPVVELLTMRDIILSIQTDGTITRIDTSGVVTWTLSIAPTRSNSLLVDSQLVIGTDSLIFFINLSDASIYKSVLVSPTPMSLVYDRHSQSLIAALTWYSSTKSDSVMTIDRNGTITQRFGIDRTRITSNLSLISTKPMRIAFGGLTETDTVNSVRKPSLFVYEEDKQKYCLGADYIIMNVAANRSILLYSGFREYEGELTSGIDAYKISDMSKQWQRRFSEPLTSSVAMSANNAYFTLSFATAAMTPSSGFYVVLDMETGKTERESAIKGARTGFTPGMPMPLGSSMLLIADAGLPYIYKIQ